MASTQRTNGSHSVIYRRSVALLAAALWACLGAHQPATPAFKGMVLYTEGGPFTIVRRDKLLTGAAGVTLVAGDMIDTGPNAFVAIKASDETLIGLGPATSVYVLPRDPTTLFVPRGWVKVDAKSATARVEGPNLGLEGRAAVMLLQVGEHRDAVFEEQGAGKLVVRTGASARSGREVGPSQFFTRTAPADPVSHPRPPEGFIDAVPTAFQDALPDQPPPGLKESEAAVVRPVTYADVQTWLTIPRDLRVGFIQRFLGRCLADKTFHDALDAHLNLHPEWTPVLHPPPPPDRSAGPRTDTPPIPTCELGSPKQ